MPVESVSLQHPSLQFLYALLGFLLVHMCVCMHGTAHYTSVDMLQSSMDYPCIKSRYVSSGAGWWVPPTIKIMDENHSWAFQEWFPAVWLFFSHSVATYYAIDPGCTMKPQWCSDMYALYTCYNDCCTYTYSPALWTWFQCGYLTALVDLALLSSRNWSHKPWFQVMKRSMIIVSGCWYVCSKWDEYLHSVW